MQVSFNPNVNFRQAQPVQQLQPAQQPVVIINQEQEKAGGLRRGISNISKFFANVGEMAKAVVRAIAYGGAASVITGFGFWAFGSIPRKIKHADTALNPFKAPFKSLSKTGKVLTIGVGIIVGAYQLLKGKLTANQRTADIDHKWKTDHRSKKSF